MIISPEFLTLAITTLALAAVGLCYLPIISDVVSSIVAQQKEKRLASASEKQAIKQMEQKLLAFHQESLRKMEKKTEKILLEQLKTISGNHSEALSQLSTAIKNDYDQNRQELKTVTDKYLGETKLALSGLVPKVEKRVDEGLDQELEKTLAEIRDYKGKRLKKIDEEIAVLVEKTIYKTLGKTLSQEDQTALIYEALAEAKEERFFDRHAQ